MNAALPTGRPGQLLAVALALTVVALIWLALVSPLLDWYGERADSLAQRRALAQHMAVVADSLPTLQREAAAKAASSGPSRGTVLNGNTDAIAGAALQQLVQDMASRIGATLPSVETLPATQAGAYRRIGLRVSLNAPWPVLIRLLQSVEQASPDMLVDDLQVHAAPQMGAPADRPFDAAFTVIAFRAATAATVAP